MKSVLPPVLLLTIASCNSFLEVDTNEDGKLADGRALWQQAALEDYRFEVVNSCFCDITPIIAEVEVRGGEIVSIVDARTDLPAVDPTGIQTIPGLFDRVQQAIDTQAHILWASYHSSYGFPILIEIDPDSGVRNDEIRIRVRVFEVLPEAEG
jgi:hypothetical protein